MLAWQFFLQKTSALYEFRHWLLACIVNLFQIEFPSILLPPSISSGSIVDIQVSRNVESENAAHDAFENLQDSIFTTYGQTTPSNPVLRCRNATQTSVVLEWDPIQLATADLRSLSLYRNGAKAGSIPRPLEITSTKISGLAIDTDYNFQLVLRTSAGVYASGKLEVRTHKMTELGGITVTPGVLPAPLRQSLAGAVERIGCKLVDTVRIDTTHFVCTEGRGREWERAVEMNIPVVRPEWLEGCEREGRIVGVRGYYLNADPRLRQVGQGVNAGGRQGHPGRTESQGSIRRGAPAPVGTTSSEQLRRDSSAPSAGLPTGQSDVSPGQPPQTTVVPPTPPAKDAEHLSTQGTTPTATTSTDRDGDDEESTYGNNSRKEAAQRPPSRSRNLVQTPFDSSQKEENLAYRTQANASVEAEIGDSGRSSRRASEGGSFNEVPL